MKSRLSSVWKAFNEVFAHTLYIAIASILALAVFVFAVWLPNIGLITDIFGNSSTLLALKLKIAVNLLGGISTNFSTLSATYTVAIAILFGINIAMVVYLVRKRRSELAGGGMAAGVGGIASGALGIGCAACGSFILSATFSSLGAVGVLAILPLRGGEFGILSVILPMFSLILISKKIAAPPTCG
ncbi:MAG: hypothetical protein A3J47_03190 [Candidatus Yanofskybacteria bacterium RIFCSPHIGHO2_02_FULL_43_22]|uniref:Uncharacterized protein n=1 Tax=Candidatus Yanofskybacteria bacterium RIFCSPHIGHO2_02_FULL_43_22 TaxID=1802681 RepID=A0A1F8FPE5_9BACT|nr:MAG: hypothetical protein A3J47_03190 [Candidatus Yanofskybacteria bacterium RIFCSPHIGHO2_02_FULL_43_22]